MATRAITVAALIEQLSKLPPDAAVGTEGCDCWGACSGARLLKPGEGGTLEDRPAVVLERAENDRGFF